jgi:hypothetical protein
MKISWSDSWEISLRFAGEDWKLQVELLLLSGIANALEGGEEVEVSQ